jgi:hypothetical protein
MASGTAMLAENLLSASTYAPVEISVTWSVVQSVGYGLCTSNDRNLGRVRPTIAKALAARATRAWSQFPS